MGLQLRDKRYNDVFLTFEEEGHKYYDSLNNTYKSTTTLLHDYKPKFDREYWLKKKAKELKISEKALAKQWDTITNEACDRGNLTHDKLEVGVKAASMFKQAVSYMHRDDGRMITVADLPNLDMHIKELDIAEFIDATENRYKPIYKVFKYYTDNGYKIYAELGAFLIDYLVSGMIDILCIREDQFVIGDWKTNRGGVQFESGYYKKDKRQIPAQQTDIWVPQKDKLLPPVHHLPDCNGSLYNLQLSQYAVMVEFILGIPCAGLWLCHIDSDFVLNEYGMPKRHKDGLYYVKQNPIEVCTIHKMPFLKKEILNILEDRRKEVEATRVSSKTLFD
jgi:hypothetical protein